MFGKCKLSYNIILYINRYCSSPYILMKKIPGELPGRYSAENSNFGLGYGEWVSKDIRNINLLFPIDIE